MIQNDKKIDFRIKYFENKLNELSTSIYLYHFIEVIVIIFAVFIPIIIIKYFNQLEQLSIGFIIIFLFWAFSFHYVYLLNDIIQHKKKNKEITNNEIEQLKSFSAYIIAYRHIEELKNGNNIYPELNPNDSKLIIEQYKNVFEDARVIYEKNSIIDLKSSHY